MNEQFVINTDGQSSVRELKFKFHPPKKYVLSKTVPAYQKNSNVNCLDQRNKKKSMPPQYFTNILKQQKKNMFVNTFLRKLKSTVILRRPPQHSCLSQQKNRIQEDQLVLQLPKIIQLILLSIWLLHAITLLILNSMALIFDEIDQSSTCQNFMILSLLIHCFQMGSKFIVHLDYQENKLTKIKQITSKYLQFQFWFDSTILIGLIMYFSLKQNDEACLIFRLLIFLKFRSLLYIIEHMEITLIQNVYREQIWSLIKVFIFNFAFAHVLTLALILMANIQPDNNWFISKNLTNQSWSQKYIWAYYWATTIMLTVGFGDITPRNSKQALCMVFIQMMSCIVLAYNINRVGIIIQKIRSYQAQKTSHLKIFNHINQKSQFSNETKTRIMNYIKQSTQIRRNFNIGQEKEFIECLPQSFQSDMLKQMNRHIWNGMMFFQNLSQQTLIKLSITIQKKLAHPQEIVYTRGDAMQILVFNGGGFGYSYNNGNSVHNGQIMQYFKVGQNKYQVASLDFLFDHKLKYDVKCTDYAVIYKLSTDQLAKILNNHSYDAEYFFMIKDKDRFLTNEFQLTECELCKKQRHSVFKCPKLHYIPLKQHIIRKNKDKYFPIIFKYDSSRKYMSKHRTLINQKSNKHNMITTRQFVNNYLAYKSDHRIKSGTISQIHSSTQINDDKKDEFQFVSGQLRKQSSQGRIMHSTQFYEQAIDEIRSKLDNMMHPTRFSWDLQVDQAFNYKFYFRKCNSDEIMSQFAKKNKHRSSSRYANHFSKKIFGYRKKNL